MLIFRKKRNSIIFIFLAAFILFAMLLYHNRGFTLQGYSTNLDMFLKEKNIPLDLIERTGLEFSNEVYYVYEKYFLGEFSLYLFGSFSSTDSEKLIEQFIDTVNSSNTMTLYTYFVFPGNFGPFFSSPKQLPEALCENLGIRQELNVNKNRDCYDLSMVNGKRLDHVHIFEDRYSFEYYVYHDLKTLIIRIGILSYRAIPPPKKLQAGSHF